MATYINILQPATGQDVTLKNPTATDNYGSEIELFSSDSTGGVETVALIKFDLSGIIDKNKLRPDNINSARIELTSTNAGTTTTLLALRILPINSHWDEFTATWNTQNGVKPWGGGAGLAVSGVDYSSSPMGQVTGASVGVGSTRTINITNFAELIAMIKDNHGILLFGERATPNDIPHGASSENISAYRPRFIMDYDVTQVLAIDTGVLFDGTYSANVTDAGADGKQFNGADYVNVYNSGLNAKFGASRTVMIQAKSDYADLSGVALNSLGYMANSFGITIEQAGALARAGVATQGGVGFAPTFSGDLTNKAIYALSASDSSADNTATFYVDGANEGSRNGSFGTWFTPINTTRFTIGAVNVSGDNGWFGTLQNYIIGYRVAATQTQVQTITTALQNNTLTSSTLDTIFGANLWSWWKLNDDFIKPTINIAARISEDTPVEIDHQDTTIEIDSNQLVVKEI